MRSRAVFYGRSWLSTFYLNPATSSYLTLWKRHYAITLALVEQLTINALAKDWFILNKVLAFYMILLKVFFDILMRSRGWFAVTRAFSGTKLFDCSWGLTILPKLCDDTNWCPSAFFVFSVEHSNTRSISGLSMASILGNCILFAYSGGLFGSSHQFENMDQLLRLHNLKNEIVSLFLCCFYGIKK